jgi:hypothetical protein
MVMRYETLAIMITIVCAACTAPPSGGLAVDSIDPSTGTSTEVTLVRIAGTFHRGLQSSLDENDDTTLASVSARIGGTLLDDVAWVDEATLTATVPVGLPLGRHDVVVDIGANDASLDNGYQVLGGATRLVFVSEPTTISTCRCAGFTIEARDANDQPLTLSEPLVVFPRSESPTMVFHADASCGAAIVSATIPAGASTTTLFFRDTSSGVPTITASSPGLTSATQAQVISTSTNCVTCDPTACGLARGSCNGGTCEILQTEGGHITCPAGMPCRVTCPSGDDCKDGVDCAQATTCEVRCIGAQSCKDRGVDCGSAAVCTVLCTGVEACRHGTFESVECRASSCDVTCSGATACEDGVDADDGGACWAHCCGGGCQRGTDTCETDAVCT